MSGKKKKIISVVIISLILIVMVMIILITKGNKKDKIINIGKSIDVDDQSSWRADSHVVAVAESGYYFLDWDYTEDSITLKYSDESSHKTIPVCAKAECMHNSAECNAKLEKNYLSSQLHYYKGNLYVVRVDSGMAKLVRIAKDGSFREEVAELFPNDNITSISLVFHDNCVYAYDHLGHTGALDSSENDEEKMIRVDLATGNISEVFSYQGAYSAIYGARSYGDKLFFQIYHCSLDRKTAKADTYYKLYCYDYETGNTEKISDKNIADYFVDTDNETLYYFVIDKGLYSRKLSESDSKMLYNADDTMVMGLLSYDGKNIYMYNGGIGSVSDLRNQIDEKIFVLNTDGTCVNTISLDSEKMGNLYYGDDKYIFFSYSQKLAYVDKKNIMNNVEIVTVE